MRVVFICNAGIVEKKQSGSGYVRYKTKHKMLLQQHSMSPLRLTAAFVNARSDKAALMSNHAAWETKH